LTMRKERKLETHRSPNQRKERPKSAVRKYPFHSHGKGKETSQREYENQENLDQAQGENRLPKRRQTSLRWGCIKEEGGGSPKLKEPALPRETSTYPGRKRKKVQNAGTQKGRGNRKGQKRAAAGKGRWTGKNNYFCREQA